MRRGASDLGESLAVHAADEKRLDAAAHPRHARHKQAMGGAHAEQMCGVRSCGYAGEYLKS